MMMRVMQLGLVFSVLTGGCAASIGEPSEDEKMFMDVGFAPVRECEPDDAPAADGQSCADFDMYCDPIDLVCRQDECRTDEDCDQIYGEGSALTCLGGSCEPLVASTDEEPSEG